MKKRLLLLALLACGIVSASGSAADASSMQPAAVQPIQQTPLSPVQQHWTVQQPHVAAQPVVQASQSAPAAPPAMPPLPDGPTTEDLGKMVSPLTPDQIRSVRRIIDDSKRAAEDAPRMPPKPVSSSVVVNLAPGAVPPVIRVSPAFVTSIVFSDGTGAAWPITSRSVGAPKKFDVQVPEKNGSTMTITPLTEYGHANLAVMLADLATPVMLTLISGQREVDYRVDVKVDGSGPNAIAPVMQRPVDGVSPALIAVLDGVPPSDAKALTVAGGQAQAWLVKGRVYLRTRLSVVSPAWLGSANSSDGMRVYELPETPLVLVSSNGIILSLNIGGL